MYQEPNKSPWGAVQTCDTLCPGVFLVSTASHGGTMVSNDVAAFLSPAAKRCGFRRGGYLCFEEDTQEEVVLRELLDKKLWKIPERIKDKAAFEENINRSIKRYGATTLAVAMLSKPWKTEGSMQRTFIRCSSSFMKSLTSVLLRRRRTTTKIGNTDLWPTWPEVWRRTKGQHSLPGAVLSLFPTGTMREILAVNQLRKGGFNGTIRYLSE